MSPKIILTAALVLCAFALNVSQALAGAPKRNKGENAVPHKAKADVCALLTSADVEAVQGEQVKETKPSRQPSKGMVVSQCLFHTATSAKSVTLTLATPNTGKPLVVRKYWQQQFHASRMEGNKAKGESSENEAERETELRKARPISGIGDEAFWVGNPLTGALYVLRGNAFLRISVGGVREEPARIEKSKALAQAALKRLRNPA